MNMATWAMMKPRAIKGDAIKRDASDVIVVVVVLIGLGVCVVLGLVVGAGVTGVMPGHIGAVPLQSGLEGSNLAPFLNSSLILCKIVSHLREKAFKDST